MPHAGRRSFANTKHVDVDRSTSIRTTPPAMLHANGLSCMHSSTRYMYTSARSSSSSVDFDQPRTIRPALR
jgi:hypothetical protein